MSSTCTSGRHGVPSLWMRISPVVKAYPTRLFTTRSARRRGDMPYAVAFRRNTGLKRSSASARHVALDQHLRFAVRRDRIERRLFRQQAVVRRHAVEAAGGGEQEPLDARFARQPRQPDRRQVIDVVGNLRIQIAERIVRQRREVDDRIEAGQARHVQVADVGAHRRNLRALRAQRAVLEEIGVQSDDVVTGAHQHVHHDRADVAVVSGNQYAHQFTS